MFCTKLQSDLQSTAHLSYSMASSRRASVAASTAAQIAEEYLQSPPRRDMPCPAGIELIASHSNDDDSKAANGQRLRSGINKSLPFAPSLDVCLPCLPATDVKYPKGQLEPANAAIRKPKGRSARVRKLPRNVLAFARGVKSTVYLHVCVARARWYGFCCIALQFARFSGCKPGSLGQAGFRRSDGVHHSEEGCSTREVQPKLSGDVIALAWYPIAIRSARKRRVYALYE